MLNRVLDIFLATLVTSGVGFAAAKFYAVIVGSILAASMDPISATLAHIAAMSGG